MRPRVFASAVLAATEQDLAREAAETFAAALALREPGQREAHRRLLASVIDLASRSQTDAARVTLVKAHAAWAEDARSGAGQLSLSAQRAPTPEACDDGWRRLEAIVDGAEASARAAAEIAASVAKPSAHAAARRAEAAARAARRIVDERNRAYTFHTAGGFSFGEGWHVAAAAVLAGVAVQIEPGRGATPQAERFLRDAGLDRQLQPYRSRPRAMKQTTWLVARAFRADPRAAQAKLRAAFLGDAPAPAPVVDWIDRRLAARPPARDAKKVLLWVRDGTHHPGRNTTPAELAELARRARAAGLVPVFVGDAVRELPPDALDLTLFWTDPTFRRVDARRAQLFLFEHLKAAHGVVGQLGVTTAGMDGPALMGLPTMYLTDAPNARMREWAAVVPRYLEVVRDGAHLERVAVALREWASDGR